MLSEEGQCLNRGRPSAMRESIHEAFHRLLLSHKNGIPVSPEAFSSLIHRCSSKDHLVLGRELSQLIKRTGRNTYSFLGNHLIRMFAMCGSLRDANQVFDSLPNPNTYAWGALISAHITLGHNDQAINIFCDMLRKSNVHIDGHVFVAALKACSNSEEFIGGKIIHCLIASQGLESNLHIGSSLVSMYSKYGSLRDAYHVFDALPSQNAITWTAMISGYVLHKHGSEALKCFQQMLCNGIDPDALIFVSMLKARFDTKNITKSIVLHCYIIECSFETDCMVGNALVEMYLSYGSCRNARKIFDAMSKHDIAMWSLIIGGYVEHGCAEEALLLYQKMQKEGVEPNSVTFVFLLNACSSLSHMCLGKLIHYHVLENGCTENEHVANALVDMYSTCGSVKDARWSFAELPSQGLVAWNIMILGCGKYGNFQDAKRMYQQMKEQGVQPNVVTVISLLSACGLQGLVQEGCAIFNSFMEDSHILLEDELYNCMVNILSRAGCLCEAEDLLQTMPCQSSVVSWMCLLCQCRMHGNVDVGSQSFVHAIADDHRHASSYALMQDMYDELDMLAVSNHVEAFRVSVNAWKRPAGACIELEGERYEFTVSDEAHPQITEIYAELKRLQIRIRKNGYIP